MNLCDSFLAGKEVRALMRGVDIEPDLSGHLFPHQRDVVSFLLKAIAALRFWIPAWAKPPWSLNTPPGGRDGKPPVLLLAPLAVGKQHEREAARFHTDAKGHS